VKKLKAKKIPNKINFLFVLMVFTLIDVISEIDGQVAGRVVIFVFDVMGG
jgi:hypothetical protein